MIGISAKLNDVEWTDYIVSRTPVIHPRMMVHQLELEEQKPSYIILEDSEHVRFHVLLASPSKPERFLTWLNDKCREARKTPPNNQWIRCIYAMLRYLQRRKFNMVVTNYSTARDYYEKIENPSYTDAFNTDSEIATGVVKQIEGIVNDIENGKYETARPPTDVPSLLLQGTLFILLDTVIVSYAVVTKIWFTKHGLFAPAVKTAVLPV